MKPYYQDEYVTIYHGDCREILPDLSKVDLVLTDFPYANGTDYGTYQDTLPELRGLIKGVMPLIIRGSEVVLVACGVGNMFLYPPPAWVLSWHWKACTASSSWGFSTWQPILAYGKDPYLSNGLGRRPDSFEHFEVPPDVNHPCPKPLDLWRRFLLRGSVKTSDIVLDPFMGSGTTVRAAKDTNRKCIGIEIEEKYCEIAANRCRQMVMELGL